MMIWFYEVLMATGGVGIISSRLTLTRFGVCYYLFILLRKIGLSINNATMTKSPITTITNS